MGFHSLCRKLHKGLAFFCGEGGVLVGVYRWLVWRLRFRLQGSGSGRKGFGLNKLLVG